MDFSKIPLFKMISRRMEWLSARQQVLAQNIANADTPRYVPQDLKALDFRGAMASQTLAPERTHAMHLALPNATGDLKAERQRSDEQNASLSGNAVVLQDELMKVAETNMSHQLATNVYRKQLSLFRLAIGRGGSG
ncbi:MAG: flagellar basal body protein [Alphaproteobacteria bacterium]